MPNYDNGCSGSRPAKTERLHRRVAGGRDHGGAGQDTKWNRNSIALPMVYFSAAATAHDAGEPEMSGVTVSAKRLKAKVLLRSGSEQQVPLRGTIRRVPEGKDEPEAAGEASTAKHCDGAGEDREGNTA